MCVHYVIISFVVLMCLFTLSHLSFITIRRALLTDQYLRVKGTNGIFALGDCSTIEQDKMIAKANELFQRGDINGDGQLTLEEFSKLIEIAKQEYPQVSLFFKKAQKNLDKCVYTITEFIVVICFFVIVFVVFNGKWLILILLKIDFLPKWIQVAIKCLI